VKKFLKLTIISALLVGFMEATSFALVDAAVWGGYVFNGKIEGSDNSDTKGGQYGLKAHYNTSLMPLLELGVGAYYQYSKLTQDITSSDDDFTKQSLGIDGNLILSLPVIHPYLRGTYCLWDKIEAGNVSDTEKFKGYGFGAGVEVTVFPFFRLFGEYMYEYSDHDAYFKSQSINLGLKFDL